MKDAEVVRISLVDRAATRMPFKVIKQENPMRLKDFDLANVFKGETKAPVPTIAAVITMKSEGFESVKTQLEKAGFSVVKAEEGKDGSVAFVQDDETITEDTTLIRINEHAVLAVKSFRPYSADLSVDGTSFADVVSAQGFYPGVRTMCEVLTNGVLQMAEKADNPGEAATSVSKMFDEARDYAVSMVKGLPVMAFKLEGLKPVAAVAKSEEVPAAPAAEATPPAAEAADADAEPTEEQVTKAAMSDAEKAHMDTLKGGAKMAFVKMSPADRAKHMGAGKEAPAKKADEEVPAPAGVTVEQVSTIVSTSMTEMAKKMDEMLSKVATSVSSLSDSVQTLSSRVEEAESVAKAANEAISGTVVLGSNGDDHQQQTVQKSQVSSGREIDTGMSPRRRNR